METPEGIEVTIDRGVVAVTIDTGDGENRFTADMIAALTSVLENPPDHAVILHVSARGPSFCLGPRPPGPNGSVRNLGRSIARLNRALASTDLITMAVVDGRAAGFGMGLACLPDITMAGDNAVFVTPEIENQLSPALVLSWLSEYVGPKAAAWMTLTGTSIDAAAATALGLVSCVAESSDIERDSEELLERMRSFDLACLREIRRFIRDSRGIPRQEAEELAIDRMAAWADVRSML